MYTSCYNNAILAQELVDQDELAVLEGTAKSKETAKL